MMQASAEREPAAAQRTPQRGWLRALLRLALLRTVAAPPAGSAARAATVLAILWLALWIAVDRWQAGPDPELYPFGISLLAWYALWALALAMLLRRCAEPACGYASMLAVVLGAVPLPLLYTSVAAPHLEGGWLLTGGLLLTLYLWLYLARALRCVTGRRQRAAACAALILLWAGAWAADRFELIPDLWLARESPGAAPASSSLDAESLLFSQSSRIDAALEGIHRAPSPAGQGFFLGFAGVGEQKVFAQEIDLAARVIGRRFGIGARKLALINDERDLDGAPLATLSGLRYALRGIAARMNLDRDVLFLSISSHGGEDAALQVSNSDLPLDGLNDEDLAEALSDAGIRWRVIVISACYAGAFIESLRDPRTVVIAAAAADRTSFGCSNDNDLTYFGEAFYRDALPGARSLRAAFAAAKAAVDERERREQVSASNPQAYFGTEMEAKLAAMGGTGI